MKNFHLKLLAVLAASMAAGQAGAVINASSTPSDPGPPLYGGGGELVLGVFDAQTGKSYVRDLGVAIGSFQISSANVPTAGLYAFQPNTAANYPPLSAGSVNAAGYTVQWGADPLLTANFTSQELARAQYEVLGAWSKNAFVDLTTVAPGSTVTPTNGDGSSMAGAIDGALSQFNTFVGMAAPAVNGSLFSNNTASPDNVANALGFNWGGNSPFATGGTVGSDLSFYQIVRSSSIASNPATASLFAGVWNLNVDGVLTYSVAAIPEPGTWAMLTAGLLAVAGIARRRMQP